MSADGTDAARPTTAVVVAPSPVPLRLGGAERHWETLRRSLEDAGIQADLVKLPVREHTLVDLLDAYEQFRMLDLSHADLVISGKYPAWMVQHQRHVVWMLHPLRGLYDTYRPAAHEGVQLPAIPEPTAPADALAGVPADGDPLEIIDLVRDLGDHLGPECSQIDGALALPGPVAAAVVRFLDHWALDRRRVQRHFAISEVVAGRADYFPLSCEPEVLVPPSGLPEPTEHDEPGRDFLAVGRLDGPKRIDLAIEAFRRTTASDAHLSVIGDGPERDRLTRLAHGDDRIQFRGRVGDEDLRAAYRRCRAVLVTPEAEDFGYVAIEALQAGRPVVTTTDSGGPAALVTDGHDALVVEPRATALARAIDTLRDDPALAARLGAAGRSTAAAHSWPVAVRRLLDPSTPVRAGVGRRGRITALSTYPIAEWPGGGPERARHLLGGLVAQGWEVEVIALAPEVRGRTTELGDGFREITVAESERHRTAERQLRRLTANVAVTDIAASVLWSSSPDLVREVRRSLQGAAAVIAVQPYLAAAAVRLAPQVPLVLDDHNHERTLKAQMLPDDEAGHWMLDRVTDAEGLATTRAAVVVATTDEDARSLESDHGLAAGTVAVVPNGVDPRAVHYTPPTRRRELRAEVRRSVGAAPSTATVALFVGSAHRPNIDAGLEVLAMAGSCPEVLFVLVGEHSDQIDRHDCAENIRLLGPVDQGRLDQLLAGADVALNPMRAGGGSNLKVLGYFASGIPVISTPLGVRGVPDPDRRAVVARIDEFPSVIDATAAELTGSRPSAWDDRVKSARELVESEFDWAVIAQRFSVAVDRAIERGGRSG